MRANEERDSDEPPAASAVARRHHLSAIWLIPLLAACLAGYLGWRAHAEHGPYITVSFKTARDIVPGQTQVRYKYLTLGTVETVRLNDDRSGVVTGIRMIASAAPLLTDHARFWVVKPRLNAINVAELETLVSGAYLQIDPGAPGGDTTHDFTGLENKPSDWTTDHGSTFVLMANKMDSLDVGSAVYFRGINVGEVTGYDAGDGFSPVAVNIFVREPYDHLVRDHSRFWDMSGVSLSVGPNGIDLSTRSLRTVLSGGITFATPEEARNEKPAANGATFPLYGSEILAESGQYRARIACVTYMQGSARGLGVNSPVILYGVQVGVVTAVGLVFDRETNQAKVRIAFDIQPARAFAPAMADDAFDPMMAMRQLVDKGMRVKIDSANLLLGQKMLSLQYEPDAAAAAVVAENQAIVLPAAGAGENTEDALADVAAKLNQIPFARIGRNLDHLLATADRTVGGAEMQRAVHSLAVTLANAADVSQKANKNLTPALEKLPDISAQLQSAAAHANSLMEGLDGGYGENSEFLQSARRTLDQVNEAARSVRLLADFLDRHPEAILSGKSTSKDKP